MYKPQITACSLARSVVRLAKVRSYMAVRPLACSSVRSLAQMMNWLRLRFRRFFNFRNLSISRRNSPVLH